MKLDRNLNADGRGKYGLIKNRMLHPDRLMTLKATGVESIFHAIEVLERAGIIDWGDTPDTEFFVIRLRDAHAGSGLSAYARSAFNSDPDYAREIYQLSQRSGRDHPNAKEPD